MEPQPYLEQLLADQAARTPQAEDEHFWATRYVFNPFHDRDFTMEMMRDLGLPGLPQGEIQPVTRFSRPIVDNNAVLRVPVGYDGKYVPVAPGIESFTQSERPPSRVLTAILRIFNGNSSDPAQDNGICEISALRGSNDFRQLMELKSLCLPQRYENARKQLLKLARVLLSTVPTRIDSLESVADLSRAVMAIPRTDIRISVGQELYQATYASFTWARWQYHRLISQMERPERSGKEQLSPLDAAVCAWIEQPEPRFQSRLVNASQPTVVVQQPVVDATPTVWCEECGATTNLGPQGQVPKKCPVCKKPFATGLDLKPELASLPELKQNEPL